MKFSPLCLSLFATGVVGVSGATNECQDGEEINVITNSGILGPDGATVDFDIEVPAGFSCKIFGNVIIDGKIDVKEGGTLALFAKPAPTSPGIFDITFGCPEVTGDIKCDECAGLNITSSPAVDLCPMGGIPVGGKVEASKCTGYVVIEGLLVDDDITVKECTATSITVANNKIPNDKDILIKENTANEVLVGPNDQAKKVRLEENSFNGELSCMI